MGTSIILRSSILHTYYIYNCFFIQDVPQPREEWRPYAQCPVLSVGKTCLWSVCQISDTEALPPAPHLIRRGHHFTVLQLPSSGRTISLPMGRPPWATPEQTAFLEGFLQNQDREKKGNGLKVYWDRISLEFLKQWPAEPTNDDQKNTNDPQELQRLAEARRTRVSGCSDLRERISADHGCQQIHDWYKNHRKKDPQASQPNTPLDLSGQSSRKYAPYQFHHAFSIRYFRDQDSDSPLHKEVDDLWNRRKEQSVVDLLAPFMDCNMNDGSYSHLQFHNAVMRWKCSHLTDEERQEHQEWIDQRQLEKDDVLKRPWKAMQGEGDDELVAENSYIQRCVRSSLLATMPQTNLNI